MADGGSGKVAVINLDGIADWERQLASARETLKSKRAELQKLDRSDVSDMSAQAVLVSEINRQEREERRLSSLILTAQHAIANTEDKILTSLDSICVGASVKLIIVDEEGAIEVTVKVVNLKSAQSPDLNIGMPVANGILGRHPGESYLFGDAPGYAGATVTISGFV